MVKEDEQGRGVPIQISEDELVLRKEGISRRSAELFNELNVNEELRKEFIRNPAQLISERVMQHSLPPGQVSAGNRFLFSLLANEKFRTWLKVYSRQLEKEKIPEEERLRAFAEAAIKYGDENIVASLTDLASSGYGIPGITNFAYQFTSGFVTPTSQANEANLSQNFNMSSQQNTSGTGIDSEILINPAILRAILEQLIAQAEELSTLGKLRNITRPIQ